MNRRSWIPILAIAACGAPSVAPAASAPPKAAPAQQLSVPFIEGKPFAEVLRRAKAEKKPILLDLYATWCGPCKLMDRTTFSDPGIGAWAKRTVVAAKVDAEKGEGRRLARRYAINSFPSILLLDSTGNEIDRLLGAFPPDAFKRNAEEMLSGRGMLSKAIERLDSSWDTTLAIGLVGTLAQRNDTVRLHPLVLRLVREDSGLEHPETLDALGVLASLEDYGGSLSPETEDMVASFLPRVGDDSRRASMAAFLARGAARSGDVARARKVVDETLRIVGESNPYAPELLAALGEAQRRAGRPADAVASFLKALSLPGAKQKPASWTLERKIDLAGALAADRRRPEATATLEDALGGAGDPSLLARGARLWLELGRPSAALALSRRAVDETRGEDPAAQAALGASLAASGDRKGAAAALARAAEFAPEDGEIRRELASFKKRG